MAAANAAPVVDAVKTDQGLMVRGFLCEPVVDKCEGCDRVWEFEGEKYCASYAQPAKKWIGGACNFATHVHAEVDKTGHIKINPLKASKRAARSR